MMKRRGKKTSCRALAGADASVDVFLVIFHFLSGGCFGRPMFYAFDGSFPFFFFFCYFSIITAAYQAWSFYSLSTFLCYTNCCGAVMGGMGYVCGFLFGTRNKACVWKGAFSWVYCWGASM